MDCFSTNSVSALQCKRQGYIRKRGMQKYMEMYLTSFIYKFIYSFLYLFIFNNPGTLGGGTVNF